MKTIGFDRLLYILPFDHRGSFQSKMFGWKGRHRRTNSGDRRRQTGDLRRVPGGHRGRTAQGEGGNLVDEQFVKHLESFHPTFCKVLVRYNPEGDRVLNRRQADRLQRLSNYLRDYSQCRLMFELLVPPEVAELEELRGDKKAYDRTVRPRLMVQAIHELQNAGVEPDVWKVEGLDRPEDCAEVVAAARRDGRDKVGCIVLGRGEDDQKVREWLATAARVPGFIGFAVGRTTFWAPLTDLRANKTTREAAVIEIARRFRNWIEVFEKGRAKGNG